MSGRQALFSAALAAGMMIGQACGTARDEAVGAPQEDRIAGPPDGPWRRLFLDAMVVEDQETYDAWYAKAAEGPEEFDEDEFDE